MKRKKGMTARGLASAAVVGVACAAVGWLCLRTTAVEALPPGSPLVERIAADDPDVVLEQAASAIITRRGILDTATLDAVRRAALAAPLDARPFLILGHQQWLDGDPKRAVGTLEAGQRLDPRQRIIHLLLLDRYLRSGRYTDAATQFSVLSRLVGAAQGTIAQAMGAMILAPETRDAARRTLATDPMLERSVLVALARSDTPPDTIFALASPTAKANAAGAQNWGPVLIARLVEQKRYALARTVWQRVHRLPAATLATPIYNARFRSAPIGSAFDWALAGDGLGAAEIRDGSLAVDYYGRDSGTLASQLLVLKPGRYRFAFTVDAGKTDNAAKLIWSLTCGASGGKTLMDAPVVASAKQHRLTGIATVPADCPAQTLVLRGEAGEFPAPTSVTLRDLELVPATDAQP